MLLIALEIPVSFCLPVNRGDIFVVVRLMKPLALKVDFQSPFVGSPATDNYIYSSPLAVTFIQLI